MREFTFICGCTVAGNFVMKRVVYISTACYYMKREKKRMQFNGGWMKEVKNRLSFTHQTRRYGPRIAYEWLFRLNCWQAVTQSALWYCKTTTKT